MSIIKSITSINISSVNGSQKVSTSSFDHSAIDKFNFSQNQTACGCADLRSASTNLINIDIDIGRGRARRASC